MAKPELGVLSLVLTPVADCSFGVTPTRSLQAALLRRIELVNPELSAKLHDAPSGASSSEKPWTISTLAGNFQKNRGRLISPAGEKYQVRITALNADLILALQAAFDNAHPLGTEPLILEDVSFTVLSEQCRWDSLSSYASIVSRSRPVRDIILRFDSPAGFRPQSKTSALPEPNRCILGYLHKWNSFSELAMQTEPLLEYVKEHIIIDGIELKLKSVNYGTYLQSGWVGSVKWTADGETPFLLRMVNALVDFAFYCGTGAKTTMGMGQTRRIAHARSLPAGTGDNPPQER